VTLREKTIQGIAWSGVQNWGSRALTFIVFLLLARLLSPEDFGLIALASAFVALAQVFVDQGFAQAIIQRDKLEPEHLNTAFWTSLVIGIILTAFGLLIAPFLAGLFDEPKLAAVVRWLSASFLLGALSGVHGAILQRDFAFRPLAVRQLFGVSSGGLLGILMALNGFGVWSLVGQQLFGALVGTAVLWMASAWRPSLQMSKKHFNDLFSFGINITGTNLLNFVNRRSDDLIIGYFLGPVALGYYSVAYRLLLILTELLAQTINSVAFPAFSRLQNERERARHAFYKLTQLASVVAFPAFLGASYVAPYVVTGLFGKQWATSIPVMQVLSFIGILHVVLYLHHSAIRALGKPSWALNMTLLNAATNIIAFLLVVKWGIIAVAAAYVIRGYLTAPIEVWMLQRLMPLKVSTYLQSYLTPLAASFGMLASMHASTLLLRDVFGVQPSVTLTVIAGGLSYVAALFVFAPAVLQEVLGAFQSVVRVSWKRT
jgi:O-antigen/teichoic acid export membrane protein